MEWGTERGKMSAEGREKGKSGIRLNTWAWYDNKNFPYKVLTGGKLTAWKLLPFGKPDFPFRWEEGQTFEES